jgi:uncharacterized protein YjbJ (UPF0337 family)
MNKDIFEGNLKHLKGRVREVWGKLTRNEFDVINGKCDQLEGKVMMHYGLSRARLFHR